MIRKSSFFIVIFTISMTISAGQVMAQKQDRIEKLLKLLTDNETEKLQKSREKLDEETLQAFPAEVELIDIMNRLWNQPDTKSATDYYSVYEKANKGIFSAVCISAKIELGGLRNRTDKAISTILESSQDKLSLSKQLIDMVKNSQYPIEKVQMEQFFKIREDALSGKTNEIAPLVPV